MRLLSRLTLGLLLVATSCGGSEPAAADGRHHEPTGRFSFVVPEGWEVREVPGVKYRIAAGPGTETFVANLNVVDEKSGADLDAYVAANRETMLRMFEDGELGEPESFRFDSGAEGVRFGGSHTMGGQKLRQTWFMLPDDGRYLIMTGSRLAEQDPALDDVFAAAARTLRVE